MPVELGRVDQAHDRGGALVGAQAAGEQPVLPPERDGPDAVLRSTDFLGTTSSLVTTATRQAEEE